MMDSTFPAVLGARAGLDLIELKRLEDSVRTGGGYYVTGMYQAVQTNRLLDFVEATKISSYGWKKRLVYSLFPLSLVALKYHPETPEKVRAASTFIIHQLTNLYQVAAVVSCVAMLTFGNVYFGAGGLALLAIGYLDRLGWLPVKCRQALHKYIQPLFLFTYLIDGNLVDKIVTFLVFLSYLADFLAKEQAKEETFEFQTNVTAAIALEYLNKDLKINKNYVHYTPMLAVPNLDIEGIFLHFDQIDWKKNIYALRKKLEKDARFLEIKGQPQAFKDEEILAFTKSNLEALIRNVKNESILQGEPADYQKLHDYLKVICKYLNESKNEIEKAGILFRLAVEGGQYCGPGILEVAESVYRQIVGENTELSFQDRIASLLQAERNRLIEGLYDKKFKMVDKLDVHVFNLFANAYNTELGLFKTGAANDDTTAMDPISKWLFKKTIFKGISEEFWALHTVQKIETTIKDAIGSEQLPKIRFIEFWLEWIERQGLSEQEKENLLEELGDKEKLFGRSIFDLPLIRLALIDMGILRAL